jgi:hypothetical protein
MTLLAWQRRARALATAIRAAGADDPARTRDALALCVRAVILRTHDEDPRALLAARDPAPTAKPTAALDALVETLAAMCADPSLDAELDALRDRNGGGHAAPFVLESLVHALDPRSRVHDNLYATPAPVARWMARAALDAVRDRWPHAELSRWTALDPACGAGALLDALAQLAPELTAGLHGIERDPAAHAAACAHLPRALRDATIPARLTLADALAQGPEPPHGEGVIVLANPPFAHDGPMSDALARLVRGDDPRAPTSYRPLAGEPCPRNAKWLDAGHLRFLRWIHAALERAPRGVAVVALGHGLLDHPTFAPVRRGLAADLDAILALDLHGAARHGLRTPDGRRDQNVFEIQQGVALLVLVREQGPRGLAIPSCRARISRADLWGTRDDKLSRLRDQHLDWTEVRPQAPGWRFDPTPASLEVDDAEREWAAGWSLLDAFAHGAPAIITGRDALALSFSQEDSLRKRDALADPSVTDEALRARWGDALAGVDLAALRDAARAGALPIARWQYRPWDDRWALDHRALVDRPRRGPVMDALRTGRTVAIVTRRQSPPERPWRYALAVSVPVCDGVLRADPHGTELVLSRDVLLHDRLEPNARPGWLLALAGRLGRPAEQALFHQAFAYAFGTLCDPAYRARFAAQLSREVPRIPWPESPAHWDRAAAEGTRWLDAHLHSSSLVFSPATPLHDPPRGAVIEWVRYARDRHRIELSPAHALDGILPEELDFSVGARRPALRWLEDRVGEPIDDALWKGYAAVLARVRACLATERDALAP